METLTHLEVPLLFLIGGTENEGKSLGEQLPPNLRRLEINNGLIKRCCSDANKRACYIDEMATFLTQQP